MFVKQNQIKMNKLLSLFNKPYVKIPTGSLLILLILTYAFKFVKVLPVFMKLGLILVVFLSIYLIINYFFLNKKENKS